MMYSLLKSREFGETEVGVRYKLMTSCGRATSAQVALQPLMRIQLLYYYLGRNVDVCGICGRFSAIV